MSTSAWEKIAQDQPKPKGFDQQTERYFSFFWSFEKLDESNYAESYQRLEERIGRVKNIRPFQQFDYGTTPGEQGRKCNLDGEHNALVYRPFMDALNRKRKPRGLNGAYEIQNGQWKDQLAFGEGLSAMGVLKRFSSWTGLESFSSTAAIALMEDIRQLPGEKASYLVQLEDLFNKKKALSAVVDLVASGKLQRLRWEKPEEMDNWQTHFDYQACFSENLVAKNYPNPFQLHLLKEVQQNLEPYLKTKYYAIVQFDGDHFGKHLKYISQSGEKNHKAFSEKLAAFAQEAADFIDSENYGRTVYAGGDDFLGFVNLHHLFPAIRYLRELFAKILAGSGDPKRPMSFSAGILISHYKTPLSEVLKMVRRLERKAKHDKGGSRNAFCISTLKHSGEIQEATFKWGKGNQYWLALQQVARFIADTENGEPAPFSGKFIQQLTMELDHLGGLDGSFLHDGVVLAEVKRLIQRSKQPDTMEADVDALVEAVKMLWLASYESATEEKVAANFIHALHIADFLSRKTKT